MGGGICQYGKRLIAAAATAAVLLGGVGYNYALADESHDTTDSDANTGTDNGLNSEGVFQYDNDGDEKPDIVIDSRDFGFIMNKLTEETANRTNGDEELKKQFNNLRGVDNNASNINSVANNISQVKTTSDNIESVKAVANDINAIKTVNNSISNVNTVAGDIKNIDTVVEDKNNIDNVSKNIDNINAVKNNETNINTVVDNMTTINKASEYANYTYNTVKNFNGYITGSWDSSGNLTLTTHTVTAP